jgi:hypothetical protein
MPFKAVFIAHAPDADPAKHPMLLIQSIIRVKIPELGSNLAV